MITKRRASHSVLPDKRMDDGNGETVRNIPIGLMRMKEHLDDLCERCTANDEMSRQDILRLCERILILDPDDWDTYITYDAYSRTVWDEAVSFYKSMFTLYPENMTICYRFCQRFEYECDKRRISAEEIRGILPKSATHYTEFARTVISLNDTGARNFVIDPEPFLKEALDLDPNHVEANRWLGLICNDTDIRLLHLKKYFDLTKDETVLVFLGNEYVRSEQYRKGLTCYVHFPSYELLAYDGVIPLHHFRVACAEACFQLTKMKNEERISVDVTELKETFWNYASASALEAMRKKYGFTVGAA